MARVIKTLEYSIADVVPYINWLYFFHAWGLSGKPDAEKNALREEAMQMLASMEPRYATHAVFGLFDANADGDDIIIDGLRFRCCANRRQQRKETPRCVLPTSYVRFLTA